MRNQVVFYLNGERRQVGAEHARLMRTVLAEPGRLIIGPFGWLLCRVEYLKTTPHKKFAILNSGMNHLIRPAL